MDKRMLRFVIFTMIQLLMGIGLGAQGWRSDFGASGPPSGAWRRDRGDFVQEGGWLSLQGSKQTAQSSSALFTNVTLPANPVFRGWLRIDQAVSTRNHSYILLYCSRDASALGWYEYIALSVGGGDRGNLSLVRLRVGITSEGNAAGRLRVLQEQMLLVGRGFSIPVGKPIGYEVRFSPSGQCSLSVFPTPSSSQPLPLGEIELSTAQVEASNSFGLLCLYTARHRASWRFSRLEIGDGSSSPLSAPTDEEAVPIAPARDASPLVINEIMANPLPGSAEYVELHNPSEQDISLQEMLLGIGADAERAVYYSLEGAGLIPAGGFVVLTSKGNELLATYPHIPPDAIRIIRMPQLANAGFYIALYGDNGALIDEAIYSKERMERGTKSKRGVALERIDPYRKGEALQMLHNWVSATAQAGYATPGQSNSRLSTTGVGGDGTTAQGLPLLVELNRRIEQEGELSVQIYAYNMAGLRVACWQGEEAKHWLSSLEQTPLHALELLPTIARGPLLFHIITSSPSVGEEGYTLRIICP